MNHKKRKYEINQVISAAKAWTTCENLYHKKAHQHLEGWFCPAEYELEGQIHRVEQMLKTLEIDGH